MEGSLVGDGGTLILKRCQVHNNKAYNLRREGTGRVEFIDMPPCRRLKTLLSHSCLFSKRWREACGRMERVYICLYERLSAGVFVVSGGGDTGEL
jgi:hypothetical protein